MTWKTCTMAAALALAACTESGSPDNAVSGVPDGSELTGEGRIEGAAPTPAGDDRSPAGVEEGMAWNFSTTAAGPKLTYGEPRTDNVKLMLRCAGENRIALSFMRGQSGGGRMTVRSDDASETVPGSAEESQLGGVTVRAEIPADAAPLRNFRAGNALTVTWDGETRTVPPAGAEAERFFSAC